MTLKYPIITRSIRSNEKFPLHPNCHFLTRFIPQHHPLNPTPPIQRIITPNSRRSYCINLIFLPCRYIESIRKGHVLPRIICIAEDVVHVGADPGSAFGIGGEGEGFLVA